MNVLGLRNAGMALRAKEYGRSVCRDRSSLGPHLVTK